MTFKKKTAGKYLFLQSKNSSIDTITNEFYQPENVPQTDSNFPSKGQFFISIFNKVPKFEKVGVTPLKTKKSCWF